MPQLETPALPNIKGLMGFVGAGYGYTHLYGAFNGINHTTDTEDWGKKHHSNLWYLSTQVQTSTTKYSYVFKASLYNDIYKESHNDVTPYNFNINIYVKV